jgi:hypothetical protein
MVLTGPKVTELLVTRLLREHDVNLTICGKSTHYPLSELIRQIQAGEIELAWIERGHRLEIRQTFVVIRVLHTKANLTLEELYELCTVFNDGSSLVRHSSGLSGIHSNLRHLEETAREIVFRNIGQSEPGFATLKLGRFTKKKGRNEVLATNKSQVWYGIKVVVEKIHFDLIIPREFYKEEYAIQVRKVNGKAWKTSYFGWRAVTGMP